MKIGRLVKHHIKKIFQHCETIDHEELEELLNKNYSKNVFGINYSFCTEVNLIPASESVRYWTDTYIVRGKTVRVSSQWVVSHKEYFIKYLIDKNISNKNEIEELTDIELLSQEKKQISTRENSRYRGNAIGKAQNLLVRNILSNLGEESFNQENWEESKAYFDNQCAYCGSTGELVLEHVIPINRASLGEHRLGNLIPSCRSCNSKKSDKDYREFLKGQHIRIEKIERYMESRNYVPLGDNEQVAKILEMAYQEVAIVSKRYISILNELFPSK